MDLLGLIDNVCGFTPLDYAYNTLLHYLAEVDRLDKPYELMLKRQPFPNATQCNLGLKAHEVTVFTVRFELMHSNNDAYRLATKADPTVADLETFSELRPCWSILFPLKLYLLSHPHLIKPYRGLLPFGSEIIKAINHMGNVGKNISSKSPTLMDHVWLANLTNYTSDLTGLTPLAVNHILYLEGQKLP